MSTFLAIVLLVLIVASYLWYTGGLNAAPVPALAPAASASSSSTKYDALVSLLQKTTHWAYFDEKQKSRQTIDFKINPSSQDLIMKASVAKDPGNFKFSKAGGRDDTMQLLDPGKGDASKYATYIMYVDDKNLVIEEKTDGKITFQQKLSV